LFKPFQAFVSMLFNYTAL